MFNLWWLNSILIYKKLYLKGLTIKLSSNINLSREITTPLISTLIVEIAYSKDILAIKILNAPTVNVTHTFTLFDNHD